MISSANNRAGNFEYEKLCTAANLMEAQIKLDLLGHANIDARLFNEHAQGGLGDIPLPMHIRRCGSFTTMILQEDRQLSGLSKKPRLKRASYSAGHAPRKTRAIFNYAGGAEQGSNETHALKNMMVGNT